MSEVVFFGAPWCVPCKRTKPVLKQVCSDLGIEPEYIDVENSYDPRANDVTSIPVIRVYDEYGEVVREHRGAATREQVLALLGEA